MQDDGAEAEIDEALDNIKAVALRHIIRGRDAESLEEPPLGDDDEMGEGEDELLEDPRSLGGDLDDEREGVIDRVFIGGRGGAHERAPQRPSRKFPVGRRRF